MEDEFEELYSSLFEKHKRHVSIVKTLAEHPGGLTKTAGYFETAEGVIKSVSSPQR